MRDVDRVYCDLTSFVIILRKFQILIRVDSFTSHTFYILYKYVSMGLITFLN